MSIFWTIEILGQVHSPASYYATPTSIRNSPRTAGRNRRVQSERFISTQNTSIIVIILELHTHMHASRNVKDAYLDVSNTLSPFGKTVSISALTRSMQLGLSRSRKRRNVMARAVVSAPALIASAPSDIAFALDGFSFSRPASSV